MTRKKDEKTRKESEMLRTVSHRLVQVAGLALVLLAVFVSAEAQVTTGKVRGIVQATTNLWLTNNRIFIHDFGMMNACFT